jgi:hypothetical protein
MTETPHLSFPLRLVGGRFATVEQDSPQHIAECVEAAARTERGWRIEAPDFGVPDYVLAAGGVDVGELRSALLESEPRAAFAIELVESFADLRAERVRILIEEEF